VPASRRKIESRRRLSMRCEARPAHFGRLTSPEAPLYPRPELSHINDIAGELKAQTEGRYLPTRRKR
jgi:hypothetical protein